jgi:hypothetical protein
LALEGLGDRELGERNGQKYEEFERDRQIWEAESPYFADLQD